MNGLVSYEYDWNNGTTTDPRIPRPMPTPLCEVWLNGERFDVPVARCKTGPEGYIIHRRQENGRQFKAGLVELKYRSDSDWAIEKFSKDELVQV